MARVKFTRFEKHAAVFLDRNAANLKAISSESLGLSIHFYFLECATYLLILKSDWGSAPLARGEEIEGEHKYLKASFYSHQIIFKYHRALREGKNVGWISRIHEQYHSVDRMSKIQTPDKQPASKCINSKAESFITKGTSQGNEQQWQVSRGKTADTTDSNPCGHPVNIQRDC